MTTTGGARASAGPPRAELFRVVDVLALLFAVLALLDLAIGVYAVRWL